MWLLWPENEVRSLNGLVHLAPSMLARCAHSLLSVLQAPQWQLRATGYVKVGLAWMEQPGSTAVRYSTLS